jgi:hypothetical protein
MDAWMLALALGWIVSVRVCWGSGRALGWLAMGLSAFVITALWQMAALPLHAFFSLFVDCVQCLIIYRWGLYRWEQCLMWIWAASVFLSVLRHMGLVDSQYNYVAGLEAINWIAMGVIAGNRYVANTAYLDSFGDHGSRIRRGLLAMHKVRTDRPWHRAT